MAFPLIPLLLLAAAGGGIALVVSKSSSSSYGTGNDCGHITIGAITPGQMQALTAWVQKWQAKGPNASAQAAMVELMNMMEPSCSWSSSTRGTITNTTGHTYEWSEVMRRLDGKTMGDVEKNPALFDFVNSGQTTSQFGPLSRLLFG
jgi:hypothetical protein